MHGPSGFPAQGLGTRQICPSGLSGHPHSADRHRTASLPLSAPRCAPTVLLGSGPTLRNSGKQEPPFCHLLASFPHSNLIERSDGWIKRGIDMKMASQWDRQMACALGLSLLAVAMASCSGKESEMIKSSTTDKTESWAFDEPETTYLGQTAASIATDHGGDSGFLLLDRGRDALSWRLPWRG